MKKNTLEFKANGITNSKFRATGTGEEREYSVFARNTSTEFTGTMFKKNLEKASKRVSSQPVAKTKRT